MITDKSEAQRRKDEKRKLKEEVGLGKAKGLQGSIGLLLNGFIKHFVPKKRFINV